MQPSSDSCCLGTVYITFGCAPGASDTSMGGLGRKARQPGLDSVNAEPKVNSMNLRLLAASVIALAILLAVTTLLWLTSPGFAAMPTRWGVIPTVDLLGIAIAMAVGGWIAGRGFGWVAVALIAVVWLVTLASAYLLAPPQVHGAANWLLRNNASALPLSALVSWLAARVGEKLSVRWPPPPMRGLDAR